ncbi:hypothetical protein Tco_1286636, partial [Tanacetum coccineum]
AEADIADFESRLTRIYRRVVHRVQVFDFGGLPDLMAEGLSTRMLMEHRDAKGVKMFLGHSPVLHCDSRSDSYLCHMISYNISRRGHAPEKVTATDLFYIRSIDQGAANVPYLLAQYLFRHAEGKKSDARLSGGYFIRCLAHHFGIVSDDGLRGLSFVAYELPLIDMASGAPKAVKDAPVVAEGDQAVPAPVQAPQQPPPPPPVAARTMPQRLGRQDEEVQEMRRDVGSLRGLVERPMTDHGRFSTWIISCMAQLMDASGLTYQAFNGTF